jgi:hypothetical protein
VGLTKKINTAMARNGVNYVRNVVESANCIFNEIPQQNDFGNDAFIELVENENVKGITIAAQIKSGSSFCFKDKCIIPATRNHFEYWHDHSLTVIGIVYDPDEDAAYWINLQRFVKEHPDQIKAGPYTVNYKKKDVNRFTPDGFRDFFLPIFLKKPIVIDYERSKIFAESTDYDLHSVGIYSLMTGYREHLETWEIFINILRNRPEADINPFLVYYVAHIPGHPDIFWHEGNILSKEMNSKVRQVLKQFGQEEILKLLSLLSEEDYFDRGQLGQSVEAVISLAAGRIKDLLSIAKDQSLSTSIRTKASLLYAFYEQKASVLELKRLAKTDIELKSFIDNLIKHLHSEGYIYLY